MRPTYFLMSLMVASSMLAATPSFAEERTRDNPRRTWTLLDIIEAPKVIETAISSDGNVAYYIVRRDNFTTNSRHSTLFRIDMKTQETHEVLRARWISKFAQVPGSADWTMLVDMGDGVQIHRLKASGHLELYVAGTEKVTIGTDSHDAISETPYEQEQVFGVFDYGWAPDGRALWYSTGRRVMSDGDSVQVLTNPKSNYLPYAPSVSELHVRERDGRDQLVASAEGQLDPLPAIVYYTDAARWEKAVGSSPVLSYSAFSVEADGSGQWQTMRYEVGTGQTLAGGATLSTRDIPGPQGGVLRYSGDWPNQRLIERRPDGRTVDFGPVSYFLNTPWSPGYWVFRKDRSAVVGVRYHGSNVRSSLVKLSATGKASDLEPDVSLTNCALSEEAERGICVRQGLNVPPSIVMVNVRTWTQTKVSDIDPRYDRIAPLVAEPVVWNTGRLRADGFIIYPRGYTVGKPYPTILLTHGGDADNTFVETGFQWSYPAQVWAEKGYVIVYVNDISLASSIERRQAYAQWIGTGVLPGDRVIDIIWLDQVEVYKEVVRSLSERKIVDPDKVGIAGFSRGAQLVNIAVTQTALFRAASSGDGAVFAPTVQWVGENSRINKMLFGGFPSTNELFKKWQRVAPAFRADKASAAVLIQSAGYNAGRTDFYYALREASVPTEYVLFRHETHSLHKPSSRLVAMEQNLDWFDYWLKDQRDPNPKKVVQYERWDKMRAAWHPAHGIEPDPSGG